MKKNFFITIMLLIFCTLLSAQTLDDVLKEHYAAIGQEALLKINSMKATGKLVQMGVEIPFIQIMARPSNVRVEGTFQGLSFIQTYNGKEGWSLNPFAGVTDPQPFGEDELKSMKYQADMDGMLWKPETKGYTVTLEGKEDMEGTSCYKIKVLTKEGDSFMTYVDADSYLPLRTNAKVKVQGNEMETDTYYSNYMQVGGIAVAGKTETKLNGQVMNTIITDKVEIDLPMDSTLFGKPVTK